MARDRSRVTLEQLERAAASLSPIEREVLLLSAREGLSNIEIEARLGLAPGKSERVLARALCRLDRAIARQARPWWRFW